MYDYIVSNHNPYLQIQNGNNRCSAHILFSPKSSHAHIHRALNNDGIGNNFKVKLEKNKIH